MLQRQIMFKQLEELQRQKKLQELNDSREQNVINQQSLIHNKLASGAQYSPLINGTPVRDPSQMFMFGNTNSAQGFQNRLPLQAQNQIQHSLSLASQQVDGTHLSSPGHSFSRFSHFQGAIGEQVDTISRSSMSDGFNVSYQERNMCGQVFSQGIEMGVQTGNDQQGFGRGQQQGDWAGNVLEKTAGINPSQDFTTLDPLEQKFLFNTDDNSLGGFGSMVEDTEGFPSLQSGSWSALMQSALEETSSTDTGIQDEWSGLSFHNPEFSNENQPSTFMESGKHSTAWQNNIFQNASSLNSRPEHLKTSHASSGFPGFQQFPAFHFQLRSDSSYESNQQSHKEAAEFEGSAQVQRFSPLQASGHAGEFEFVNDYSNNGREFKKESLAENQRNTKASEVIFRSSNPSGMSAIVDTSAGIPAPDSSAQTSHHMLELLHKVDKFREYRHGTPPASPDLAPTNKMPKVETDAFTPSNNSSAPQYFGLRLAPPTPRLPTNYFDSSQISQQADTTHLVPLMNQSGQRASIFETQQPPTALGMGQQVSNSTRQPNVWVDVPSQQNLPGIGFYKAPSGSPSTSDVANSRIETASAAPKESDSQMYVKGGNDLLESSGHMINSQGSDNGRTYFEEQSFSGRAEANASSGCQPPTISARQLEAFGHSLKQTNISAHGHSPVNSTYSDSSTRASLKIERVDSNPKVPPLTSMSEPTSAYEHSKTLLTTREDQLLKNSSHPPLQVQDTSQIHRNSSFVQMNLASTSQYGNVWPVSGTHSFASQLSSPYLPPVAVPKQDLLVPESKKRKLPAYELLPWHKEATKGSSRLHDMSISELEWAQAANRLPEQLKEEAETLGDSQWSFHPKKRIILTTQLMQVLFRPASTAILSNDATACYDTVTYFAARLALGDACSLANSSCTPCDISDSLSEKNVISKGSGHQDISKIIESFIERSKKLEDDLLRFENGGSILEIRMESQDLERFSVINRFAKFHSRAQTVAAETASSGGGGGTPTIPKLYPQRYVAASPMPKMVPEGHNCLSL